MRADERDSKGARYEGEWKDNVHHGRGVYVHADGWVYNGDFVEGTWTGQGKFTWPDGSKYEGGWKNRRQHGQGSSYNPEGHLLYRGEYKEDERWSAAHQHAAKEEAAQEICIREFKRNYEFSETDKYGNRTVQAIERLQYSHLLENEHSRFKWYGGHPALVFVGLMTQNGVYMRGQIEGYCIFRKGTYLTTNDLIDVEMKHRY